MRRSICSVCERKYWAQVISYGPTFQVKNWDNQMEDRRATKPKTSKCKKHAAPTKVYPKTAKHHFSKDIKRHKTRRTAQGLAPKTRKEKEDATV
ncbi:MAG: hypothetical protein ACXAEN_26290 [Candidatus Thorarchaeota archaeon]